MCARARYGTCLNFLIFPAFTLETRETRIYVSFEDMRQIGRVHAAIESFAQIVCSYMALLCRPRFNDSSYILRFTESHHLE